MISQSREHQAPLLKKAEGPAEKFCFDCAYFLRGSGECVHPKVAETARLVWGGNRSMNTAKASVDAGLMRLFWCSPRAIFWQRRTADQREVDSQYTGL